MPILFRPRPKEYDPRPWRAAGRIARAILVGLAALVGVYFVLAPDVLLGIGRGEVAGWVSVTDNRDPRTEDPEYIHYQATVMPLAPTSDTPRGFSQFGGSVGRRLAEACRERGVNPTDAHFQRASPEMWSRMKEHFARLGMPAPFGGGGQSYSPFDHQLLCRLRYAGLWRHVMTHFEEYPAGDEDRLRQEEYQRIYRVSGGRYRR